MAANSEAELATRGYTFSELMVAAAAREISDGELVFVGMRLPMLAFSCGQAHARAASDRAFENGIIRETPSTELLYTMGDPPNLRGATQCGQMLDVMGLLPTGRVEVGFLGAAEVDRFGNLNTTWGHRHKETAASGSGGACISPASRAALSCLVHDRALLVRVGHVASPRLWLRQ